MRVALDATPLLGQRTGIGRYTEHLITALADRDDVAVSATAFTLRGAGELAQALPPRATSRSLPIPARLLRAAWTRTEFPRVSLLAGRCDVFHGTNFVLPPTGKAGGVMTVHDLAYLTMPDVVDDTSRQLRELVPRSLRRAAAVCTPSQATADAVLDTYGSAVPDIVVTPLGVQPEWLTTPLPSTEQRRALGLPEDYFLFVGTREPRKDLATLLAAYQEFRSDRGTDAPTLLLVGPQGWGPGQQPAEGVVVRGYAPIEQLRTIVAGARALVMPSRDEGFGLPALEGLATGVRVIVSRVPALVEVTGGHADVFDIGDVAALAALLELAAKDGGPDRAPAEQVRRRRRDFAAASTWQRCAAATVTAYRIAVP